jgi:hypothetical protein
MFLHNGWRRFARSHAIDVGHFDVFKYDGHRDFSVKVFDEIMCCRHYHSDEDTTGQRQDKDDVVSTMFLLCFYLVSICIKQIQYVCNNGEMKCKMIWPAADQMDRTVGRLVRTDRTERRIQSTSRPKRIKKEGLGR